MQPSSLVLLSVQLQRKGWQLYELLFIIQKTAGFFYILVGKCPAVIMCLIFTDTSCSLCIGFRQGRSRFCMYTDLGLVHLVEMRKVFLYHIHPTCLKGKLHGKKLAHKIKKIHPHFCYYISSILNMYITATCSQKPLFGSRLNVSYIQV